MASENSAGFDEEIKVDTDDVALNEQVYQILMQDVVVKQEDADTDDNNRMEVVVDNSHGNGSQLNETVLTSLSNIHRNKLRAPAKVRLPMPKPIKHRRISRVEKSNNSVFHRYLNRRRQPAIDSHNQSSSSGFSEAETNTEGNSTEISNEEMSLDASSVSENVDEGQSVISCEFEGNDLSELVSSTPIQYALDETSSATMNVFPSTSGIMHPPDNVSEESTRIDSSEAESQIFDGNSTEEEDVSEVRPNEATSTNMAVAQGARIDINGVCYDISVPIVLNDQRIQPAENIQIAAVNTIRVENRCEPCAYTFKTPRNFEKHLLTKKHLQKMARMNR